MLAVRDRLDELGDAEVAVVFFDGTDRLDDYRAHHGVPAGITLLADPDRRAYDALDLGRGSWWKVWGPRTFLAYARLIGKGRRYERHRGDSLQLGGDIVIGPDGRLAYVNRPPDPDARPPVDDLVNAVTASR